MGARPTSVMTLLIRGGTVYIADVARFLEEGRGDGRGWAVGVARVSWVRVMLDTERGQ